MTACSALHPALSRGQNQPEGSQERVADGLRVRYEAGFTHLAQVVPDSDKGPDYWPLWALIRFKKLKVRWARLNGPGYFALEQGDRAAGWLAIVPPGHEFESRMPGVFALDPNPNLNVLAVKPVKVTEEWAGIFLTNALSRLADRVLGVTPPTATHAQLLLSQFRADNLELMAIELLSKGAMSRALDSVLDLVGELSLEQLGGEAPRLVTANLPLLNSSISAGEPLSHDEARLRAGLFVVALILRKGQRSTSPLASILPIIDKVEQSSTGP